MSSERLVAIQRQDIENLEKHRDRARNACLATLAFGMIGVFAGMRLHSGELEGVWLTFYQLALILSPLAACISCVIGRAKR